MTGWNFFQWVGALFAALLFVYVCARLVSAAYFRSKQDHENSIAKRELDATRKGLKL